MCLTSVFNFLFVSYALSYFGILCKSPPCSMHDYGTDLCWPSIMVESHLMTTGTLNHINPFYWSNNIPHGASCRIVTRLFFTNLRGSFSCPIILITANLSIRWEFWDVWERYYRFSSKILSQYHVPRSTEQQPSPSLEWDSDHLTLFITAQTDPNEATRYSELD